MRTLETYEEEKEKAFAELSDKNTMVLATSGNDLVTARCMSVVVLDGKVYFQTGKTMDKYRQLAKNPKVALCVHNVQIQGVARDIGPWARNPEILQVYKNRHESSFESYGSMKSQTVVEVTLRNLKKWEYVEGNPWLSILDFEGKTVRKVPYDTREDAVDNGPQPVFPF